MDAARTVVRPARHDVDVDVGDRLPSRRAVVDADRRAGGTERLADRSREPEHRLEQCGGGGGLELLDRGDVRARHDQHVPVGERLHVEESHHLGLAGHDLGGNLAAHDAAEDAARRHGLT